MAKVFITLTVTNWKAGGYLAEIGTLKKHIINYSRPRSTYEEYRKVGYSKKFLEAHREEITLHKAAKAAFIEEMRPAFNACYELNKKESR